MPDIAAYLAAVVAGSVLIASLRLLTVPATFVAAGMAFLLLLAGGWSWLAPALAFLFLAGLWTRWPGASHDRDRTRRARQVLANGIAPMLFSLAAIITGAAFLAIPVAGCYAAAAADTWATEWGGAFGGRPLDLRTLRLARAGQSGAVSALGTAATVAGAASVAVACAWAGMIGWELALPVTAAGAGGSLIDSLSGAWLQGLWRTERGELVEERRAGEPVEIQRGVRWIDNDVVNLIATASGGVLAWLIAA
ncbi:MAG: hypothetical protein MAG453_01952 [Calditrichaeota bacterium]|nr:hypothetical protein [Calditrichota bacterium]